MKPTLFDRLFGRTVEIELSTGMRQVSRRWFNEQVAAGIIQQADEDPGADAPPLSGGDPIAEKARQLVQKVLFLARAAAGDLARVDESLRWTLTRSDDWAFFLQVACLGLTLVRVRHSERLLDFADNEIDTYYPKIRPALRHFLEYVKTPDDSLDLPSRIGVWVLTNTRQSDHPPAHEEVLAAPKVGQFCLNIAQQWENAPL